PAPQPPHDLGYYRDRARAAGTYFTGAIDLGQQDGPLGGVIFAEQGIHISGSGLTGTITLVAAHGDIHISGSQNTFVAAVDGVMALAASGNVAISGNRDVCRGSVFALGATFDGMGSDNVLAPGPVVAQEARWSGSRWRVGACCDGAGAPCTVGVGACARQGTMVCQPNGNGIVCDAVPGDPQPERCNGI